MLKTVLNTIAFLLVAAVLFAATTLAQEPPRVFRVPFHTLDRLILVDVNVNAKPSVSFRANP